MKEIVAFCHSKRYKIVFTTIITINLLYPHSIFANEGENKSYFVKPIDTVCDYPFNDTTKWAVTCRVWGLLKYYHPNVTAGKFDWDQVLIDRMCKINEAETPEQVNSELMQMIRIAAEYEMKKDTMWNDSLNMNVNLCWLDHSFINDTIKKALKEIASLTVDQPSHYIKSEVFFDYFIASPNEINYNAEMILQYEYRLLALFRYWNVIYYFYPYKYLMDQSWEATLIEFIPHFKQAFDFTSYYNSVLLLATRLNDGHGFLIPKFSYYLSNFNYITLIDSKTVIRNPIEGCFLERGDIIVSIDNREIASIRDSIASIVPSSNRFFTDNFVNCVIYQSIINSFSLTVIRDHELITVFEDNKKLLLKTPTRSYFYKNISKDILYINMDMPQTNDISGLTDSLKNYSGIIFDLRNYPLNIELVTSIFLSISATQDFCFAMNTLPDLSHNGAFYKHDLLMKFPDEQWSERYKYEGKIVVLINADTFSAAELNAMIFRINGATLIGTPTAGANGNFIRLSLPGEITACYSGVGMYYPNGEQVQRTGIIPDIEVYPTMDDIMAGRDEVLEAAITFLNSN